MVTQRRTYFEGRVVPAPREYGWGDSTRPSRKDALPENTHYTDSGCDLHPSCLTCPLVRCRYDEPGGARRLFSDERDRRIVRLQHEEQLSIDLLAQRFGVSRRTVFRVLARARRPSP